METYFLTTEELFGKKKEKEKIGSGLGGGWDISGLIKKEEEEKGIKTTEELFGPKPEEVVKEKKTAGRFNLSELIAQEKEKPKEVEEIPDFSDVPQLEDIKIQENTLEAMGKTYSELESFIDTDYKQYLDLGSQLDELESSIQEAPPELQFMLNQKYNRLVNQHNALVDKIKTNTKKYETLYSQLNEESRKYNENITKYNQWAEYQAKAAEPKSLAEQLADIRLTDIPGAIPEFFKGVWHGIISIPQSVGGLLRQWGETEMVRAGIMEFPKDPRWQGIDEKMFNALYERKLFKKQLGEVGEFASEKGQEIIAANREYVKDILPPEEANEADRLFFDVGAGFTSLALAIGASVVSGSPHLPALMFGAHAMGHTYQEAREAEVDPLKASALGTWNFATEAALEYIGLEFIMARLPFSKPISMALKGANEAFQEYMQEAGTNLVAKYGWDKMRKWNEGSERAALIGFILGGTVGGVIDVVHRETGTPKEAIKPMVENTFQELKKVENEIDYDTLREEIRKMMDEAAEVEAKTKGAERIEPSKIIGELPDLYQRLKEEIVKNVEVLIEQERNRIGAEKLPEIEIIHKIIDPKVEHVIEEFIKPQVRAETRIAEINLPEARETLIKETAELIKEELPKLRIEPKLVDIKPPKREDVERQVKEVIERELSKAGIKLPDFNIPDLSKKIMPQVASTIKDFSLAQVKELRAKPRLVEADVSKLMEDLKVEIDKTATEELWKLPEVRREPKKPFELTPENVVKEIEEIGTDEGVKDSLREAIRGGAWTKENRIADLIYKPERMKIDEIRAKDESLDAVLKTGEIREFEGKPWRGKPVIGLDGEVLDGTNRIAQAYSEGETEIEVLKAEPKKPEIKVPEKEEVKPTKEPWQLTRSEYGDVSSRLYNTLGNDEFIKHPFHKYSEDVPHEWFQINVKPGELITSVDEMYYRAIRRALLENKPVPQDALADYHKIENKLMLMKAEPKFLDIKAEVKKIFTPKKIVDLVDDAIYKVEPKAFPEKYLGQTEYKQRAIEKTEEIIDEVIAEREKLREGIKTIEAPEAKELLESIRNIEKDVTDRIEEFIKKDLEGLEPKFPDFKAKIEKQADHEYGKAFDKLTAAQKRKTIEMASKEESLVIPDKEGEYIKTIGLPTRGFKFPTEGYAPFYATAKKEHAVTDSHMLITEPEAEKKITKEWEDKILKAEIKAYKQAGMSQKEAETAAKDLLNRVAKEDKPLDKKVMDNLFITARQKTHEQPAQIQGHRVTDKDAKTTYLSDGQTQAAVNTNFLAFFDKYLPGYALHLQDELSPIMIKVKGKEAGLVMPIRVEDDLPFAIDDIRGEVKRPPAETLKKAQELIDELKGLDKGDRIKNDVKYIENDYWLLEHKGEVYGYLTYDQKNYINNVDFNVKNNVSSMPSKLYDKFSRTQEGKDYLNEKFSKSPGSLVPSHEEVIIQSIEKRLGIPKEIMESYPKLMEEYNKSKDWYLVEGDYHYFLHESVAKEAHDTLIDIAKRYESSQFFIEKETPRIETVSKRERISDNQRALHKAMLEMIQDPVQIREIWKEAHAKDPSIDERAETIVAQIKEHGAEMDFDEFNTQLDQDLVSLMSEDKKLYEAVWEKLTEGLDKGKKATNHDIWERIIQENTPFFERPDERSLFEETEEGIPLLAKAHGIKLEPEPTTPKRINKTEIMTWAEEAFNIPIKGKATFRWQAAGKYYPKQQIVRMEKWGELWVATHEIAHALDWRTFRKELGKRWRAPNKAVTREMQNLDYTPARKRTHEGFAEYIRYLLTTDKAAEMAPNFHKYFHEEVLPKFPDIKKKLEQFKDMLDTWNKQGAENRMIQHIDWKGEHTKIKGIMPKLRAALEWLNIHFNDEFYYPQKLTREIEKALGKKLRPTMNPAIMLEYSKSKAGAIARTFVMDKAIDEYGNVVGDGLIDILKNIPRKDMKQFVAYAISKRAINLAKRGIESGFDLEDAVYIVKKYQDKGWDSTVNEVTNWSNHVLDWLVRAGAFDKATTKLFRDLNPVYLPFKRAFIDEMKVYRGIGGYLDTGKGIKAIKGSGRPIINPMEAMVTQMRELIAKAQKIRIAKTLIDISEQEGMGGFITRVPAPIKATTFPAWQIQDFIERIKAQERAETREEEAIKRGEAISEEEEGWIPTKSLSQEQYDELLTVFTQDWQYMGKENIVSIWRDGQRRFYEIHPDLYEALKGVDPLKLGPIARVMAPFARILRLGATGLKVSFGFARNPFRDAFSYAVFSKRNNAKLWDPIKGYYKDITCKPGEVSWKFKALGGGISGQIGFDRASVQNTYDEMLDIRLGKIGKALHVVKHPVIAMQDLLSITEMGPRSAEIEAAYKKYTSKEWLEKHPDWTEEDAFVQAFNDAQDVTVNFTKSGKWAKQINQIAAFYNVAIRGPEKVYRSLRERPIQTLVKGVVWCTLLALGNWYNNRDKEWYKNLPHTYKYSNIWFEIGDNVYRLPIPFELGIVFMSAPQAMMDTIRDKDDRAFKGLLELAEVQIPDPTPSVFKPAIEVATNKNWLGNPIESPGMQYLYPTERKRDYTSKLAVALSKGADEIGIKLSPIQIDYLIDGYSGGFLKQFRLTGDQLADYPVLGDLILRDPGYPSRQLNEFFSDYELWGSKKQAGIATKEELRNYAKIAGFYSYYKAMQDRIKRAKEQKNNKLLKTYYKMMTDRLERYGYK